MKLPCCLPPPPYDIPSSHSNDDDHDENGVMCSICLEPFESGEEIAWSKHMKCQHIFHSDCLEQWLMKHDDCPICRKAFIEDTDLFKKELESNVVPTDNTDGDNNNNNDEEENELDDDETIDGDAAELEDEGVVYYVVNGLVSYVRNTSYSLLSTPTTNTTATVNSDQVTAQVQNVPTTIDTGSSLEKIDEEEKDMEFCDNPQDLEHVAVLQEEDKPPHEKKLLKGKRRMNHQRYNSLASSDDDILEEEESRKVPSDANDSAIGNIV